MNQIISINLSYNEFDELVNKAVVAAIDRRLKPFDREDLLTIEQAKQYLKCSSVFLWRKRKEGKIRAVNAGKKVLYPKSSLDDYIQIKKRS